MGVVAALNLYVAVCAWLCRSFFGVACNFFLVEPRFPGLAMAAVKTFGLIYVLVQASFWKLAWMDILTIRGR